MKRLAALKRQVEELVRKDPDGYKKHPLAKLLASIAEARKDIYKNPLHKKFNLGKTLGGEYTHWKRAKDLLPDRYRMFFRAHSPDRLIIICWINDNTTLRKQGSKTDVYRVFKKMLDSGLMPDDIKELKKQSEDPAGAPPPDDRA
jgi:toxin YhaV